MGHSRPAVTDSSYCKVAEVPYVGTAEADTVPEPAISRIPLTVTPVVVFAPLPARVRLT